MPVKYRSEVPSISKMASSAFSLMSWRARSWRCWRSSRVIGVASGFRDFNFASDDGREASASSAAAALTRERDATAIPAVTPLTSRNRRREIMNPPRIESGHYRGSTSFDCRLQIVDFRLRDFTSDLGQQLSASSLRNGGKPILSFKLALIYVYVCTYK